MKIHYISCHSILEYDEVLMLTELGHQVFSNGAYLHPEGHYLLPRPGIPGAPYFPEHDRAARIFAKTELPAELIDPFDLIIVMHTPEVIDQNWKRFKGKPVIWRSIGQSHGEIEQMISSYKSQGLKVVRYSPKERSLPNYAGEDALIRFYKDPNEFKDWNGNVKRVVNMSQTLKGRRDHCHYDEILAATETLPFKVYGSGNEDLGPLNGGGLPYHEFKEQLRDNRAYVYGGTWPAPYTLSFIEAMMTGIPIVSINAEMAEQLPGVPPSLRFPFFEIPDFIQHGESGFICNGPKEMKHYLDTLLADYELAKKISSNARLRAIDIFGKDKIKEQWRQYLGSL